MFGGGSVWEGSGGFIPPFVAAQSRLYAKLTHYLTLGTLRSFAQLMYLERMRAVVQRVTRAEVRVDGASVGRIKAGLAVLVGVAKEDTPEAGRRLAEKIVNLRIFADAEGRMNRSLIDTGGSILCVSQFTLYGDCRKGRRPSYDRAAAPAAARTLYELFLERLRGFGVPVETGQFQAMMEVELVNDGPVTLLLDSEAGARS